MDNILGRRSSRYATDKQIRKGFRFLLLLIFTANMCGLLLYKIKKELQLLTPSKKFQMNQIANQIKYEQIKAVNFTIDQ